jgi:hypothetical protein
MVFLIVGGYTLVALCAVAAAFAVVCTKWTLGKARTSALLAYGYTQALWVGLASVMQQKFNGVHLMGAMLSYACFAVVWVRWDQARYEEPVTTSRV